MKDAQATTLAVFLARMGESKEIIRAEIASRFSYDLHRFVDTIRLDYQFDVSCQGTAPEAIVAFLGSTSWEDAVRNAVSLGGDSDTLACITGGISEAFYSGVPEAIAHSERKALSPDLSGIVSRFVRRYCGANTPSLGNDAPWRAETMHRPEPSTPVTS